VTAYIAAQLTATGKAFHSFYGMNMVAAQVLGVAIILCYVIMGGFRAVAISDFVQGILMFLGLVGVPIYAIYAAGGFGAVWHHLEGTHPELLNLLPAGNSGWLILLTILGLAGPGLGFLGSPQVYQRIIALKSDANLKRATVVAILYTILTDSGAILCGVVGRFFVENLTDVEAIYPTLVESLFPPILIGLFVAIILSAIMSTADSLLILAATTLVRDLYQKVFRPDLDEKRAVLCLRWCTLAISLIALMVAAQEIRLIFWFALFGWAGIACAFCPPLILTLFWKRTNKFGVIGGALTGFLTAILWKTFSDGSLYEMVPGFLASFVVTILISLLVPGRRGEDTG